MAEAKIQMAKIIIDVRTPKEFAHSHIPDAYNIPVLLDAQHEEVGTLYKHDPLKAKFLGAGYACENIAKALQDPKNSHILSYENEILITCARGGMRSQSLFCVLESLGLRASKLAGGYKSYRHQVLEILQMPKKEDFITLCGATGCGKSEIIQDASDFSIDLERLACHYGSSFGGMASKILGDQPTQKMFENLLAYELENKKSSLPLLIEAESKRLGNIIIPKSLASSYQNAFKVHITSPIELRIKRIKELYGNIPETLFLNGMQKIKPYIQGDFYKEILNLWEYKDLEKIAEILILKYYDKVYKHSHTHLTFEHTDRNKSLKFFKNLRNELANKNQDLCTR